MNKNCIKLLNRSLKLCSLKAPFECQEFVAVTLADYSRPFVLRRNGISRIGVGIAKPMTCKTLQLDSKLTKAAAAADSVSGNSST